MSCWGPSGGVCVWERERGKKREMRFWSITVGQLEQAHIVAKSLWLVPVEAFLLCWPLSRLCGGWVWSLVPQPSALYLPVSLVDAVLAQIGCFLLYPCPCWPLGIRLWVNHTKCLLSLSSCAKSQHPSRTTSGITIGRLQSPMGISWETKRQLNFVTDTCGNYWA